MPEPSLRLLMVAMVIYIDLLTDESLQQDNLATWHILDLMAAISKKEIKQLQQISIKKIENRK